MRLVKAACSFNLIRRRISCLNNNQSPLRNHHHLPLSNRAHTAVVVAGAALAVVLAAGRKIPSIIRMATS
jgi:hypothetical protein